MLAPVALLGTLPATAILDAAAARRARGRRGGRHARGLDAGAAAGRRPARLDRRGRARQGPRRRPAVRGDGDDVTVDGTRRLGARRARGVAARGRRRRRRRGPARGGRRGGRRGRRGRARDALRRDPVAGPRALQGAPRHAARRRPGGPRARLVRQPGARWPPSRSARCRPRWTWRSQYAKERFTFGRAIGSYQAVKHGLTEVLRRLENARSLLYYAGWAAKDSPAEFPLAASAARSAAGGALDYASRQNIQTHGGIGATWEHDAPLYFRRAQLQRRLRRRQRRRDRPRGRAPARPGAGGRGGLGRGRSGGPADPGPPDRHRPLVRPARAPGQVDAPGRPARVGRAEEEPRARAAVAQAPAVRARARALDGQAARGPSSGSAPRAGSPAARRPRRAGRAGRRAGAARRAARGPTGRRRRARSTCWRRRRASTGRARRRRRCSAGRRCPAGGTSRSHRWRSPPRGRRAGPGAGLPSAAKGVNATTLVRACAAAAGPVARAATAARAGAARARVGAERPGADGARAMARILAAAGDAPGSRRERPARAESVVVPPRARAAATAASALRALQALGPARRAALGLAVAAAPARRRPRRAPRDRAAPVATAAALPPGQTFTLAWGGDFTPGSAYGRPPDRARGMLGGGRRPAARAPTSPR